MIKALSIIKINSISAIPLSVKHWQTCLILFVTILVMLAPKIGWAQQQTKMNDFVLFSGAGGPGTSSCPSPGYAVQLGSSSKVIGGTIGSLKLVKTTGTVNITGNIFSKGTIFLANSNTVTGKMAASNSPSVSGTTVTVGSNANLGGNIDANGNIKVSGGIVSGKVTHPAGTSYTGPAPSGGNITGTPSLPLFPALPAITPFPAYPQMADITTTRTITPGGYDDVKLKGNQTLTFKGTGIYVIHKIENRYNNSFVFDFQNDPTGRIILYIHDNAILSKLSVSTINGGSASRIYTEIHGMGEGTSKSSFNIANGSTTSKSKWLGTVWAPYAAINVGSGTGSTDVTGALWSGTQVNIQSGVTIKYAPLDEPCTPPVLTVNDAVVCSTEIGGATSIVDLTGYVTVANSVTTTYSKNGTVIANPAAYLANNGDVITVKASTGAECSSTETFTVTVNDRQIFGICAQGKVYDLIGAELTALYQVNQNGQTVTTNKVFYIDPTGDKVLIEIVFIEGREQELLNIISGPDYGFQFDPDISDLTEDLIIVGFYPISNLLKLNTLFDYIKYVRPAFPRLVTQNTWKKSD